MVFALLRRVAAARRRQGGTLSMLLGQRQPFTSFVRGPALRAPARSRMPVQERKCSRVSLLDRARAQISTGGDDWLGAPLAVPEVIPPSPLILLTPVGLCCDCVVLFAQDVRENGEQEIGEEVDYWQTHSGDIGTGGG